MSWTFAGFYGLGSSPDLFRRGWSNTSGAGAWSLSVANIPFEKYDVIVYMNWDGSGSYSPVKIGDDNWTWDAVAGEAVKGSSNWGVSKWDAKTKGPAVLGENAMRINDLELSTLDFSGSAYCNVCAIQIIEHVKPRVYQNPLIITIR